MTNSVEAIVCMLGATSLGAAWSSCSPDFGVAGVVDRLGQVKPKVLFFATSYVYNGKRIDTSPHLPLIMDKLGGGTVPVTVPYWPGDGHDHAPATSCERDISTFEAFLNTAGASDGHPGDIKFEPTPFNHPVYIMFSSGTNGPPKCMVHGAGGTLLQTKKELVLHSDMRADDRLLFFTTTGWMMWQWSVSALSIPGARLITYEGSPSFPGETSGHVLLL
jgi:acetoacetyl-CoA synthetase